MKREHARLFSVADIVYRTGKVGSIEIDGVGAVNGESTGQSIGLDTRENIFLGKCMCMAVLIDK